MRKEMSEALVLETLWDVAIFLVCSCFYTKSFQTLNYTNPITIELDVGRSHVWGHFCLCYEGKKLINDKVHIRSFGINNGDQVSFYILVLFVGFEKACCFKFHNFCCFSLDCCFKFRNFNWTVAFPQIVVSSFVISSGLLLFLKRLLLEDHFFLSWYA